jgi:glycosyltransferase involved in cell wall biosynthesis
LASFAPLRERHGVVQSVLRILYLSPRQCYPPITGAKLRDYYLARALGEAGELTYVHFDQPDTAAPVLPFCERVVTISRVQPYTPGKILQGLTGRWPLPVVNYTSTEMIAQVLKLIREKAFDLVHVDCIQMAACEAALREALGSTPTMYNWHNIESELMLRYSEGNESPLKKMYARMTAGRLAKVESMVLESATGHVVCSEREHALLAARAPHARIAVVANGVDTGGFKPAKSAEGRKRIVFVGAMSYHANIDAAVWFAREIWPQIRARMDGFVFTIVGSNPAPEVLALRELPGVEVTGTVPDISVWYSEAFAAVVPLRVGAGTRLKILEAMAAGVPVISTSLGAEGLEVSPGKDILLVDEAGGWAEALAGLEARWTAQASAARELVCSRYDWQVIGKSLVSSYLSWLRV